jgi:glyceraldehyde-3-phosphate dehydrogenase (NADP+)
MESGQVDVLAFIGSGRVADIVSNQHPEPHRLTKILGLGAKNPSIVLADADLQEAVAKGVKGSLSYNGQRCTALKMHFVDTSIADEYAAQFAAQVEALNLGMPWEKGAQITPLAEGPEKIKFLSELVADAVEKGAHILNTGGGNVDGNLFTPAVLYPVTPEMRIYREEQFGPVVPIMPIESVRTAVEYLANSEFGQQVSVFGGNTDQLNSLARTLAPLVGRVNLNDECKRGPDVLPFSGRKSSALGTLSVVGALEVFSLPTVIARGQ